VKQDFQGGFKWGTLGLKVGTVLVLGKTSYKDWPASFKVNTRMSASFLNSDHVKVEALFSLTRFFLRLHGYKHGSNCITSQLYSEK